MSCCPAALCQVCHIRCTDVGAEPGVLAVRLVWADPSGDKAAGARPHTSPGPATSQGRFLQGPGRVSTLRCPLALTWAWPVTLPTVTVGGAGGGQGRHLALGELGPYPLRAPAGTASLGLAFKGQVGCKESAPGERTWHRVGAHGRPRDDAASLQTDPTGILDKVISLSPHRVHNTFGHGQDHSRPLTPAHRYTDLCRRWRGFLHVRQPFRPPSRPPTASQKQPLSKPGDGTHLLRSFWGTVSHLETVIRQTC